MVLTFNFMLTLVRQRAIRSWVLFRIIIYSSFVCSYVFTWKQINNTLIIKILRWSKIRLVLLFGSIVINSLLFCKRLPVLPVYFVFKMRCSIPLVVSLWATLFLAYGVRTYCFFGLNFWLSLSLSDVLSETLSWTLKSWFRPKFNLTSV